MPTNDLRDLLEAVRAQQLSVDAALRQVNDADVADLGFAKVDLHAGNAAAFPKSSSARAKRAEWVEGVVRRLVEAGQDCLATRVSADQADHLAARFPQAEQDRVGPDLLAAGRGSRSAATAAGWWC